jgi:ribosome recycling factor
MLENIFIDAYGSKTPLNQLGNISSPDSNMLTIQVWDVNLIKKIENSILESNLGINPQVDGALVRLPIPKLSEERRSELTKIASQYAENFKVSIRNIRRDFIEIKKREKKESQLSEDELKKFLSEAQNYTDKYITNIDNILEQKKSDIMRV